MDAVRPILGFLGLATVDAAAAAAAKAEAEAKSLRINTGDRAAIRHRLDEALFAALLAHPLLDTEFDAAEAEGDDERAKQLEVLRPGQAEFPLTLGLREDNQYHNRRMYLGYTAILWVLLALLWSWLTENNPRLSKPTGILVVLYFVFSGMLHVYSWLHDPNLLFVVDPTASEASVAELEAGEERELAQSLLQSGLRGVRSNYPDLEYMYEFTFVGPQSGTLAVTAKHNVGEFFTEKGDFAEAKFNSAIESLARRFVASSKSE